MNSRTSLLVSIFYHAHICFGRLPSSGGVHQRVTSIIYLHPSMYRMCTCLDVNHICGSFMCAPENGKLITETYVEVIQYAYQ
jgi:hypothetical protein